MDEEIRTATNSLQKGDVSAFANLVAAKCRLGQHFYANISIFTNDSNYQFRGKFDGYYDEFILNAEELAHNRNTPPISHRFGVNLSELQMQKCVWCKREKTLVKWDVLEEKHVNGRVWPLRTIIRSGSLEI